MGTLPPNSTPPASSSGSRQWIEMWASGSPLMIAQLTVARPR
jgi:hypothetical protein